MKLSLRVLAGLLLWAGLAIVSPAHAANELGTGICETTTTTGTGTLSLGGAYTAGGVTYLSFASQIASGNSVPYTITASNGKFEHGTTVFTDAGTDTLTRNALWSSDGSGVELTLPAGTHIVCLQIGEASHGDGDRGDITVSDGFQAWGIDADSIALTTDTTGNYVATVVDGTAIDGTCASEACAYTPVLDMTEINTFTLGGGSATGIIFDAGASDPAIEVATGTYTIDIGGTNETVLNATNFSPGANDGNALGVSGTAWADLFLASGGLIEFDGNTTNSLTCTGGNCTIEGNGLYRAGGTDVAVADGGTGASTLTDLITLTTMTTGVYVAQVADGTGVDGTANGEGATYTPTLDLTEITPTVTWGGGSFTTETFDVGASDIAFEFASGTITTDIGGTNETTLTATAFSPGVNDGNALGTAALSWADIFLATGGTIEWDGGSTNTMVCTGGSCTIEGNTMYRAGGTDVAVADGGTGASSLADLITLTTHTTGNYVATVADGTGVDGTASGEGTTFTPTLDFTEITPTVTWGAGSFTTMTFDAGATDPSFTFGSGTILMEGVTSFRQADAANLGGNIRLLEDPGTGSNYIGFLAPASITSDVTCTLENDSNPIPDSCVGDGTDAGGGGSQTPWTSNIDMAGFDLVTTNIASSILLNPNSDTSYDGIVIDNDSTGTSANAGFVIRSGTQSEVSLDASHNFSGAGIIADVGSLAVGTDGAASLTLVANGNVQVTIPSTGIADFAEGPTKDALPIKYAGKQTIWIPASATTPRASSGAGYSTYDSGSNDVTILTADFDQTTAEYAHFQIAMPKSWNEGTFTFQPIWTATSSSGTAIFSVACVAISNDDTLNVAMGTAQTSSDTLLATNDQHTGPESSAITCAGTPAEGDLVAFQLARDISDTLAADARLIGIKLYWTDNAANDD